MEGAENWGAGAPQFSARSSRASHSSDARQHRIGIVVGATIRLARVGIAYGKDSVFR